MKYTLVSDDDGHEYIIPYEKLDEWEEFLQSEECELGDVPEYAERKEGETLIFENYTLGN